MADLLVGLRRQTLVFLRYLRIRPTGASAVWRPTPSRTITILPGPQVRCMGAERMPRIACLCSWDHVGRRSRRAVGSSDRAAPPHGASASGTGSTGRRRQSSRPHRPDTSYRRISHHGFSAHRRASSSRRRFYFSGDTSTGAQPGSAGCGRWNSDGTSGMVPSGVLSSIDFVAHRNENLHPTRQGQSIPAPLRVDSSLPSRLQPFPASFTSLSEVPYVVDCLQGCGRWRWAVARVA